jgi:hypothetical protein
MIHAYVARRSLPLYLLGAVLFLFRIDGLLLFGMLASALAIEERRVPWRDLGWAILVASPWLIFATIYFGSPVPTSLIAKVTVYRLAPPARYTVTEAFHAQFLLGFFQRAVTLLALVGFVRVIAARWMPADVKLCRMAVPIAWMIVYYGTMFASPVPAFAWYFLPPWPVVLLSATIGIAGLARMCGRFTPEWGRSGSGQLAFGAGLLAIGAAFGIVRLGTLRDLIKLRQETEDTLRRPIGLWFHDRSGPGERVLLEPIGYVGYFSQRRILDLVGLVSPEVFASYRTPHYLTDIVERLKPEWLCLRPLEVARVDAGDAQLIDREYEYVRSFGGTEAKPEFRVYHRRLN